MSTDTVTQEAERVNGGRVSHGPWGKGGTPKATKPQYYIEAIIWSEDSPYSTYERAAAQVVADCFGRNPYAFPGAAYVARRSGMSRRKAEQCMRVLRHGDPEKGKPPLFTYETRNRQKPGKAGGGYVVRVATDPAALVAARKRKQEALAAIMGRIEGHRSSLHHKWDKGTLTRWNEASDRIEALQRRRVALQQQRVRRELDAETYGTRLHNLRREAQKLAREVASADAG